MEKKKRTGLFKSAMLGLLTAVLICATVIPVGAWLAQNRSVKKNTEMQLDDAMVVSSSFTAYRFFEEDG